MLRVLARAGGAARRGVARAFAGAAQKEEVPFNALPHPSRIRDPSVAKLAWKWAPLVDTRQRLTHDHVGDNDYISAVRLSYAGKPLRRRQGLYYRYVAHVRRFYREQRRVAQHRQYRHLLDQEQQRKPRVRKANPEKQEAHRRHEAVLAEQRKLLDGLRSANFERMWSARDSSKAARLKALLEESRNYWKLDDDLEAKVRRVVQSESPENWFRAFRRDV